MSTLSPWYLLVGSYTRPDANDGLSAYEVLEPSGELELACRTPAEDSTYLAVHPQKPLVYVTNELRTFQDEPGAAVSSYRFNETLRSWELLGRQPTGNSLACHVSLDPQARYAVVSNYGEGSVAVFPIETQGQLGPRTDLVHHAGKLGPHPTRQVTPHAHCALFVGSTGRVLVSDLGLDCIISYELDFNNGKLREVARSALPPGTGPRHLCVHPKGGWLYSVNELTCEVTLYRNTGNGVSVAESWSLSVNEGDDAVRAADIQLHPNGRFLYASNRGRNTLTAFAIAPESGRLTCIETLASGGAMPRSFAIHPNGRYLYVANLQSHSISQFRIDPSTGQLDPTGYSIPYGRPACLKFTRLTLAVPS